MNLRLTQFRRRVFGNPFSFGYYSNVLGKYSYCTCLKFYFSFIYIFFKQYYFRININNTIFVVINIVFTLLRFHEINNMFDIFCEVVKKMSFFHTSHPELAINNTMYEYIKFLYFRKRSRRCLPQMHVLFYYFCDYSLGRGMVCFRHFLPNMGYVVCHCNWLSNGEVRCLVYLFTNRNTINVKKYIWLQMAL